LARSLLGHSIIISPDKENCGLWFVAPVTSTVGDLAPASLESLQHFISYAHNDLAVEALCLHVKEKLHLRCYLH